MITHDSAADVAFREARISGSARAMIVSSIATMKTAAATAASVSQAERGTRSIAATLGMARIGTATELTADS